MGYDDKAGTMDDKVKWAEFGTQVQYRVVDTKLSMGGWSDVNSGATNAVYSHYIVGLETRKKEGMFISYMLGPAFISQTDNKLGSNLQCSHEAQIGYKDSRDVKIGLVVKHFSNAGLVKPNQGRNMIGLNLEAKFQ